MDKREEGSIKIFRRKNFVSQCRKVRRGILYCCIKFVYRKSLDKRVGGGIKIFRRKNFVSQCRKVRRGILYCCINFGYRKSLDKRGEYQEFPSKNFCLTVRKFSVGESFTVAVISGSEKLYGQEGGGEYQDFPSKIFCLTVLKIFVEDSFSVALISGTEKVWRRGGGGGGMKILRRKSSVSQCRKVP